MIVKLYGWEAKWCFAAGWREGAMGVALETAREVSERYPDMNSQEIILYLNGAEDGRAGDRWRLDDMGQQIYDIVSP